MVPILGSIWSLRTAPFLHELSSLMILMGKLAAQTCAAFRVPGRPEPRHTVDDINLASPNIHHTTIISGLWHISSSRGLEVR